MCVSPFVARQWLGKNVTTATNTHAIIEDLLDVSTSMWSLLYQEKKAILPRTSRFGYGHAFQVLCFCPHVKA
jgi:hypothetical protein